MITPLYGALLALLFIALSVRTIAARRALRIAVGDAGNPEMLRRMRVHANFAEYVPLTLLLFYMLEMQGAPPWLLHGLCLCLLAGRLSHAYGVSQVRETFSFRVSGMAMTFAALGGSALVLLVAQVWRRFL